MFTKPVLLSAVVALWATLGADVAPARAASIRDRTFTAADGQVVAYALSVPDDASAEPRPLILALHPGGERMPRRGGWFAQGIVLQAVADLKAIVVAPDCPTARWTDPAAEQLVLELLASVMRELPVDRRRVLVIGFSMGGAGAWYLSSRHPKLFTAAIPMAASVGDEPIERRAIVPTYVIHSRADATVPFAPAERNAVALERLGRPIVFEALDEVSHFSMGGYVPALRRAVAWVSRRWTPASPADR